MVARDAPSISAMRLLRSVKQTTRSLIAYIYRETKMRKADNEGVKHAR